MIDFNSLLALINAYKTCRMAGNFNVSDNKYVAYDGVNFILVDKNNQYNTITFNGYNTSMMLAQQIYKNI